MAYSEHYFESDNVHVFPCAYRGQKDSTHIFDPEARANTEKNLTHLATGLAKKSYIIEHKNDILKCVIDGYYFEIQLDGKTLESLNTLYIKTRQIQLAGKNTDVLDSFIETGSNLDRIDTDTRYYFTGLYFGTEKPSPDAIALSLTASNVYLPEISANGSDHDKVVIGSNASFNSNNILTVSKNYPETASNILEVTSDQVIVLGALSTSGDTTVNNGDFVVKTGKQVTLESNVDATAGLDVAGTDLTVGGSNFKVTTAGSISSVADASIATNGSVYLSASGKLTTVNGDANIKGDFKTFDSNSGSMINSYASTKIIALYGSSVNIGNAETVTPLTVAGSITANGGLTVASEKSLTLSGKTSGALYVNASGNVCSESQASDSPTTGTDLTTAFIDTVAQDYKGRITATKKKFTIENGGSTQGAFKFNSNTDNISVYNLGTDGEPTFKNIKITGQKADSGKEFALKIDGDGNVVKNDLTVSDSASTSNFVTKVTQASDGKITVSREAITVDSSTQGKVTVYGVTGNLNSLGTDGSPTFSSVDTPKILHTASHITIAAAGTNDSVKIRVANVPAAHTSDSGTFIVNGGLHCAGTNGNGYFDLGVNAYALNSRGNITASGDPQGTHTLTLGGNSDSLGAGAINLYGTGSAIVFEVGSSGDVTANSYNATSDKRLKENIIDYVPEKSILELPIKKFDFINGLKNQIGCLAQDLQEICPEIVNKNENGYLSIQENKLIYLLLDEVKKLKTKVEKLEGK